MQKARPIDDRVLIRPDEAPDCTPHGIYLPETARKKPQRGEVLAVGPGKVNSVGERLPMQVVPGDVVYFHHWASMGQEPGKLEGAIVIREDEILAVVEK